jgi:hypothetical protein
MNIRFHGYVLEHGDRFSLKTLFDYLASRADKEFMLYKEPRVLHLGSNPAFYTGCLVTKKKDTGFHAYHDDDKTVRSSNLPTGVRFAGFNFFILDKKSGRGLYSTVLNGLNVSEFFALIATEGKRAHKAACAQAIKDAKLAKDDAKGRQRIEDQFACHCHRMFTAGDLESILMRLQKISAVHVHLASPTAQQRYGQPLLSKVGSQTVSVRIDQSKVASIRQIVKDVIGYWKYQQAKSNYKGLSVSGSEGTGDLAKIQKTIKAIDSPEDFGVHKVAALRDKGQLNPNDIVKSEIIGMMIEVAKKRPEYFE